MAQHVKTMVADNTKTQILYHSTPIKCVKIIIKSNHKKGLGLFLFILINGFKMY